MARAGSGARGLGSVPAPPSGHPKLLQALVPLRVACLVASQAITLNDRESRGNEVTTVSLKLISNCDPSFRVTSNVKYHPSH